METIDGTGLLDLSWNHYTWNIVWGFSNIRATGWKIWWALDFAWNNITDYIILPNETFNGMKDFTVSAWVNYNNIPWATWIIWEAYLSIANSTNHSEFGMDNNQPGVWHCIYIQWPFRICSEYWYSKDIWRHIVFTKNNATINLFIDWDLKEQTRSGAIANIQINAEWITLWQEQNAILWNFSAIQAYNWKLDDLRIYEWVLSEERIEELYKLER